MELKLATEIDTPQELLAIWNEFRREVKSLLESVSNEKFLERPSNRWSLSEVGEHLYLSQMNIARTLPIVLAKKFGEDTDEQESLDYEKMRNYFLKPTGVKNPESVAPTHIYSKEEVFSLLDKSQKKLENVLENKTKSELQKRGMEHPFFGLLNMFNFLWVLCLHEHSHLVAIRERVLSS